MAFDDKGSRLYYEYECDADGGYTFWLPEEDSA